MLHALITRARNPSHPEDILLMTAHIESVPLSYLHDETHVLQDLYDAGCRFVQLDDTNLAYLCDPKMRSEAESRHGSNAGQIASQYAALINKAISKRPKDMTIGIHLCRGNHRSQWFAQGG